ncbi:MAG: STAS domain-containing protein [Pirellulales bacterium]
MTGNRRLELSEVGDVTVVRFVDRKILDVTNIHELGRELFALVEEQNRKKLLLNFGTVEFLSSETLGELIKLEKKVKQHQGRLMFSNIKPEIYEVFAITRLNKLFDIRDEEAEALAAFTRLEPFTARSRALCSPDFSRPRPPTPHDQSPSIAFQLSSPSTSRPDDDVAR